MQRAPYSAFRLGDVRGIYPDEINEEFVRLFACAFVRHFNLTGTITIGRDMRESSLALQNALIVSNYTGIDPEVGGIDNNIYPRARTIMFGAKANF